MNDLLWWLLCFFTSIRRCRWPCNFCRALTGVFFCIVHDLLDMVWVPLQALLKALKLWNAVHTPVRVFTPDETTESLHEGAPTGPLF